MENNQEQENMLSYEQEDDLMSSLAGYPVSTSNEPEKNIEGQNLANEKVVNDGNNNQNQQVEKTDEQNQDYANYPEYMINLYDLPEDLQEYVVASREDNFDVDKFRADIKKRNDLLALGNKEFYEAYLRANHFKSEQNPDGVLETDEDVAKELARLSPLELKIKVNEMKQELRQHLDSKRKERLDKLASEPLFDEEEYKQSVEEVILRNNNVKEFFGFQFNEVEKKEIDEAFRTYTRIDPSTGKALIHDIIEDDDMLYKVIAFIHKGESGIKSKISERIELAKQKIMEKLGVEPTETGGGTIAGIPTRVNPDFFI